MILFQFHEFLEKQAKIISWQTHLWYPPPPQFCVHRCISSVDPRQLSPHNYCIGGSPGREVKGTHPRHSNSFDVM